MNTLASLMNLGGPDLIVILLIILVLFGAKKLPGLAKGMGQAMKEFQKAKDDFNHELTLPRSRPDETEKAERKTNFVDVRPSETETRARTIADGVF